mmetsp:Transcript_15935/g.34352  ORF Transcript_15935/g.34352 Transcript_15935/m.34352 type:complete len:210 (-) Transcript_15935:249-878(-)
MHSDNRVRHLHAGQLDRRSTHPSVCMHVIIIQHINRMRNGNRGVSRFAEPHHIHPLVQLSAGVLLLNGILCLQQKRHGRCLIQRLVHVAPHALPILPKSQHIRQQRVSSRRRRKNSSHEFEGVRRNVRRPLRRHVKWIAIRRIIENRRGDLPDYGLLRCGIDGLQQQTRHGASVGKASLCAVWHGLGGECLARARFSVGGAAACIVLFP